MAIGDPVAKLPPPDPASPGTPLGSVATAMRLVLDAERDAAQQIARCEADRQAALEATRAQARRIAERAEAIAQAIHGRIDRVASERAECRRQAVSSSPPEPDEAQLAAAIARLAAGLTGADA